MSRRSDHVEREFGDPTVALPAFRGRSYRTAADYALLELADALRLGVIGGGDRLPPISEIAKALGISPANTSLALKALEAAGVVAIKPGRGGGVFVQDRALVTHALASLYPPVPEDEIDELFEAMFMTERDVAVLAARRATEDDLSLLNSRIIDVRAGLTVSVLEYSERTVRFLIAMATVARNGFFRTQFADLINRVAYATARRGDLSSLSRHDIDRSVSQYEALFVAIKTHDLYAVERAVNARRLFQEELRNHDRR